VLTALPILHEPIMEPNNTTVTDTPTQTALSIDAAMKTIERVEAALAARNLKCHSGSALGSLFAAVRRLAKGSKQLKDERWRATFLRANEAIRIARAVEAALDDEGAKEAIHRVTDSNMNLATRQDSRGKDSLWELDLYRQLKLGGSSICFREPDLVVSLGDGLGDYAIACKKVYSIEGGIEAFKRGCDQLVKHGKPGIVAFNLDDLAPESEVWSAPKACEIKQRLEELNIAFIKTHKVNFSEAIKRGECDGVLVSTSVISDVPEMARPISVTWSTAVWNHGAVQDAQTRFAAFKECLDVGRARLSNADSV